MQRSLVMTIIGLDRPGLVGSIAGSVAAHGGNWLESRMSHLGGHFAGILRVEVPAEKESALTKALESLTASGLTVVIHRDASPAASQPARVNKLEIVGQDRPGIVSQISQALTQYGVNVEDLETECASAAMSGETLFKATATISLPESCNAAELRQRLEKIAEDLIVEVSLEEVVKQN